MLKCPLMSTIRKLKTGFHSLRAVGFGIIWSAARFRVQRPLAEARFAAGQSRPASWPRTFINLLKRTMTPPTPTYRSLGDITSVDYHDQSLIITCGQATVRIDVLAPDLMRIRLAPDGHFGDGFSYAIEKTEWPAIEVAFEESADALLLRTASMTCRVQRSPCRLTFLDANGRLLASDAEGLGWPQPGTTGEQGGGICRQRLAPGAHFYGLGEKAFGLDRRGRRYDMVNSDPECYTWYDDPLYQSIPFFLALVPVESLGSGGKTGGATAAYGILLDNASHSVFDFGYLQADQLSFAADSGEMRYYFMAAPKLTDVLETYTALTGHLSLPPLWALGYHQARWSYPDEQTVRDLAAEFRRRRIPCDALYLDIDYMDGFRCFTWNERAFPNHRQMLADLRADGIKTVAIIDAGIKMDPGYAVHDDGLERGAFLTYPDGTLFHGPVWPGECYFPDFTNPAVRDWWGELYAPLVEDGIAGFWNDMNEPSIFRQQTMPGVLRHDFDGHSAAHREIHNAYGTQMARATADGLARLRPEERQLVISRAAFAGHQRHAMVWTGDNYSTWEGLRLTIPMGLSLGMSGLAFNGADVGGFMGDCTGELLARWTQLGAFTPFFRNHAAMHSVQQEPWAFGPEIEAICKRAIELRYELLPYLVTAFWECSQTGLPIMRPLVLAYQSDSRTATLDDQFLLGGDLLVAPVIEPGVNGRRVYLPAGVWVDFWTGQRHVGSKDIWADAPLDSVPLYVKAGTVLPMQPVMQHTDEPISETLLLRVYSGTGESLLYEDDGRTIAYRTGDSRLTRFAMRGDETWLEVVHHVEGGYESPRARLRWEIIGLAGMPDLVEVDRQEVAGWRWDEASHMLVVETGQCKQLAVRGATR